jgi:hypothetical protein
VFVIMSFEKPAEGQIRVPETPPQYPTNKGKDRQSIKNKGNHIFFCLRMTDTKRERGRDSPTTKGAVTQPVRATGTGLPLAGSRLENGIFTTSDPSVYRPGGFMGGHIAFDLFQRLADVVVKHNVFSIH